MAAAIKNQLTSTRKTKTDATTRLIERNGLRDVMRHAAQIKDLAQLRFKVIHPNPPAADYEGTYNLVASRSSPDTPETQQHAAIRSETNVAARHCHAVEPLSTLSKCAELQRTQSAALTTHLN